jgi:uncharacterized membrane protein SpoIIM required for sporulation
MIIDLQKFVNEEQKYWQELETILHQMEEDPFHKMSLKQLEHFHYLYQRVASDLVQVKTFAAEKEILTYLESLVGRAYCEIHETRGKPHGFKPGGWLKHTFPRTFRRHARLFMLATLIMVMGSLFGAIVLIIDPDAKRIIMPFPHLLQSPSDRVATEENARSDRMEGHKTSFASMLMTHNTRVSINVLALGFTWGIGTIIMLFFNGILLGAVAVDYILEGETVFLLGWLLPHGVIEIPAVLIAGQAGLLVARTLIGRSDRTPLKQRFRHVLPDLTTLIFGVAILLVWAGLVEAFLSQYHEPFIPYGVKIGFGLIELAALIWFLGRSGKQNPAPGIRNPE